MPRSKRKVLYWEKAIADAKERGAFTMHNVLRAGDWAMCACGEQDARIPRAENGEPLDPELAMLGGHFYAYVREGHSGGWPGVRTHGIRWAATTLVEIERRAAEVLRLQEQGLCR